MALSEPRTVRKFPRAVRELEHVYISLADGCRLAARIWLPADATASPVPAILEYLPYRKRDGTAARDALTHPYWAGHGYACVRVDLRGSGESDGLLLDEYLRQEQDDALEVIDWLVKQTWCSGRVGMVGISWGGFNALQVAARQPEALRAVITICSTDDRYADDIHYRGGALLMENLGWAATMLAFQSRPPDPALIGESWRKVWLERLEQMPILAANWLQHQHRDEFWRHGSVCEDFSAIQAPVFAVGGWGDAYSNAVPRLLSGLSVPRLGLVGPWVHKYPHFAVPQPAIGFLQEALRWWDYWLKDQPTGIMDEPLYRAYLQDSVKPQTYYAERTGHWVAENTWPGARFEALQYWLNPGRLDRQALAETPLTLCSPQTTGIAGGEYCAIWLGPEMPADQRQDDAGSLVFDSEALAEPLDLWGAPQVELLLAADRQQANVIVRLSDIWPDGAATRITYGVLNLCHRDSHESPEALEPGRRYRVRLQLDDIAYRIPAGHRLRLAVSTAYWPLLWPSPRAATLTLVAGACRLTLPRRRPQQDKPPDFAEPEAAPALRQRQLREPMNKRTVEQDMRSGLTTVRIVDDFGEYQQLDNGLISGEIARETYAILPHDPQSCRADIHWTQTLARDAWSVRSESFSAMWSDEEYFYLKIKLVAYEGPQQVFCRQWERRVARQLV